MLPGDSASFGFPKHLLLHCQVVQPVAPGIWFGFKCCAHVLPQLLSSVYVTPGHAPARLPAEPGLSAAGAQSKEKLLTDLRKELAITTQEHFEVLSAVMQDKEIEALRENRTPEPGGPPSSAALLDSGGPGKRKKDAFGQGAGRCMARPACHYPLLHSILTAQAACSTLTIVEPDMGSEHHELTLIWCPGVHPRLCTVLHTGWKRSC